MKHDFQYRFCAPLSVPEELGGRPPAYRRTVEQGVIIERDVAVAARDGVKIHVDVFRPADERPAPPIVAWGPYGKHGPTDMAQQFPKAGIAAKLSAYTAFEAPDPVDVEKLARSVRDSGGVYFDRRLG
jgi:predicted acyl esterase